MSDSAFAAFAITVVAVAIALMSWVVAEGRKTNDIRNSCADRGGRAYVETNSTWACISPDGRVIEAKR